MTLGLIIVLGVMTVYVSMTKNSKNLLQSVQLGEEINALSHIISTDLKRAGYWSGASQLTHLSLSPYSVIKQDELNQPYFPFNININASGNCISFAYDSEKNNSLLESTDLFAYRLKDKQIQSLSNVVIENFTHSPCANDAGRWMSLTDKRFVVIKDLQFSTQGSECFNLTTQEHSIQQEHSQQSSCYALKWNPSDRLVEIRQIGLILEAELAQKSSSERPSKYKHVVLSIPNHLMFMVPDE